jgi:hypothetical protein
MFAIEQTGFEEAAILAHSPLLSARLESGHLNADQTRLARRCRDLQFVLVSLQ